MKAQQHSTYVTKAGEIERKWYLVDAQGKTLGRLASRIAPVLTGKTKPIYSPNLDCGDYVIVINCEKIHVTGKRLDDKFYWRHSGYPGGIKKISLRDLLQRYPERAITFAVKGMLPKGALGHQIIKKLKVYAGSAHPHEAQKPETLEL